MSIFKSFTDDSLSFSISNVEKMDEHILNNHEPKEWMSTFFKDHKLQNTNYDFDIYLKYDFDDPSKYDVENAITLYETFLNKHIDEAVVFNEKFLPAFTLQYAYEYYVSHRIYEKHKIKSLMRTLFFETDSRRALAYQLVGRLYLLTRMSIDERLDDKYFYTKYVLQHSGLRRMVFYTYVDNKIASLALVKAVYEYEQKHNKTISTGRMEKVLTHLSCLSNVNHVQTMSEEDVYTDLIEYLEEEKF